MRRPAAAPVRVTWVLYSLSETQSAGAITSRPANLVEIGADELLDLSGISLDER